MDMNALKNYIQLAFDAVSGIRVSGDDVEKMAVAREALRNAWGQLKTPQDSNLAESGEDSHGG